ncbi:MAG: SRPBCC domain-containing protein [Pseudomonadota bacterium]
MTSSILVSLRVVATPARAFDVFTREIGLWWRPNILFQFSRSGTGKLAFEPGLGGRLLERFDDGGCFEIGRITAWKPGEQLAFSWRQDTFEPDQVTQVNVEFEPVGSETRVTVTHSGWDDIPQEHAARHTMDDAVFMRRHGEWWQALLRRLRSHIA